MIEKWNYILRNGREVIDLVVPHTIVSLSHRAATQVMLEQRQDHWIALRDIETEGDFPGRLVIAPWPERHVEAPFAIRETGKIVADLRWNLMDFEHGLEPFLLIARTSRIVTAVNFTASTGGSTGLSSKQPDLFSELQRSSL